MFNEYAIESKINKDLGADVDELSRTKRKMPDEEADSFAIDQSQLEDDASIRMCRSYTLLYRGNSSPEEEDPFEKNKLQGTQKMIKIVKQNNYDKLELYKDRLPFLRFRKFL